MIWGFPERSHLFRVVLDGFWRFWGVSDVLRVSWGFQMLSRHSHGIPAVLNGLRRFGGILWYCLVAFWCVLSGSKRILSVLRWSLIFLGVISRFNSFSGVLMDSERFYMVLFYFETYFDILKCSEAFSRVLRSSQRFSKLFEVFFWCERIFWGILIRSHESDRYMDVWDVLWCFGVCSDNLSRSHVFWVVLKDS